MEFDQNFKKKTYNVNPLNYNRVNTSCKHISRVHGRGNLIEYPECERIVATEKILKLTQHILDQIPKVDKGQD